MTDKRVHGDSMRLVRWGMIGAGSVAEAKSGPAFRLASRSQLVAVMRRTPGMAADYARRHGIERCYESAVELVQDPEVDAIYIATPPGSHKELALLACAFGKPTYMEKPMARSYRECVQINEAFEAKGLPLFVAYYRRRLPRFLAVKRMIDDGTLGAISSISYLAARTPIELPTSLPWRLRAEHSGGGLFVDLGSHVLDLIDYLFGPIAIDTAAATNRSSRYEVEDRVSLRFTTGTGVLGVGEWDFLAAAKDDLLTIVGSGGRLRMSIFGDEPLRLTTKKGEEALSFPNPTPIQLPLIQSVVDELCGEGTSPSTGRTGARTSMLIDAALEEFYGGRGDAFWDRPSTWPGRLASSPTTE